MEFHPITEMFLKLPAREFADRRWGVEDLPVDPLWETRSGG